MNLITAKVKSEFLEGSISVSYITFLSQMNVSNNNDKLTTVEVRKNGARDET